MFHIKTATFQISKLALIALMSVTAGGALSGCDLAENQLKSDREASLEVQDYKDSMASRLAEDMDDWANDGSADSSIPQMQPYVASEGINAKPMPLVSISVNQTVPLKDVLYELAQQADYDIELDPRISGSIIFTARSRPFDQVVERIANIAGLRYKIEDDMLRVELDKPYNKIYKIDYLSYIRSNESNITNDVSVVSGDGTDTGSNFASSSTSEIDFWGELETNMTQIIGGPTTGALKTSRDPSISVAEQNPQVQSVAPPSEDGSVQVAPPQATLNIESLPVDAESEGEGAAGFGSEGDPEAPTFTLNRQAGIINVFGNDKVQKEVQSYLKLLEKSVTSQVLIEAKVLEVTLADEYATGINWNFLGLSGEFSTSFVSATGNSLLGALGAGAAGVTFPQAAVGVPDSQAFTASFFGNDIQALIGAISQFGTVKALASPRLTVLNNQSAVLNVATNRVFFEIEIETTTEDGTTNTDVESEIRNVPEGVLINVQPSINLNENTVSMAVRPTITKIDDVKQDPGLAIAVADCGGPCTGIVNEIPELNVQEIDSVIKVRSGQPIVMGGLLQDRIETNNAGVPIVSEAPIIGNLFKDHSDSVSKTELVIFLKATILANPADTVHNTDKDLYRRFSSDRRPFRL